MYMKAFKCLYDDDREREREEGTNIQVVNRQLGRRRGHKLSLAWRVLEPVTTLTKLQCD